MRNNHFGGTLHQASSRGVVPDAPCLREALPSPTAEDLRHVLAREAHSDPHHPILARPQKPGNYSEISWDQGQRGTTGTDQRAKILSAAVADRSEEHTSELQSPMYL